MFYFKNLEKCKGKNKLFIILLSSDSLHIPLSPYLPSVTKVASYFIILYYAYYISINEEFTMLFNIL